MIQRSHSRGFSSFLARSASSLYPSNPAVQSEVVEARSSAVLRSLQGSSCFSLSSPRCGVSHQNAWEQFLEERVLKYFQVASPVFAVFQPYYRPSEVVEVPSGFPRVQGQWFSKEPSGGVPQDIAVAGYDDFRFSTICRPQLTSYRIDVDGMAAAVVSQLRRKLNGKAPLAPTTIVPGAFVRRDST